MIMQSWLSCIEHIYQILKLLLVHQVKLCKDRLQHKATAKINKPKIIGLDPPDFPPENLLIVF